MTRKWTTGLISAAAMLLAGSPILAAGGGSTVSESIQVANHHIFNTDIEVNGATILVRDLENEIVTATVMTGALEPDFAYSIWWVIFTGRDSVWYLTPAAAPTWKSMAAIDVSKLPCFGVAESLPMALARGRPS